MEHDMSKDFAFNINKGDAMFVTTLRSVIFPHVDSNDGGILKSWILPCFQHKGEEFGELVDKLWSPVFKYLARD